MNDAALEGLKDPARHPFPPDQKAALLFADAMSRGDGRVSDDVFDDLRRHFDEAQTVEIACVVGLFHYFNRFNNALHVEVTLMDPDVLARRAAEIANRPGEADAPERILDLLHQGRRFAATILYAVERGRPFPKLQRGPTDPAAAAARVAAEVVRTRACLRDGSLLGAPLVRSGAAAGALVVDSDRREDDDENFALLERVVAVLLPYL